MIPLGVLQWAIDLMLDIVQGLMTVASPLIEWVISKLFQPILDAIASAVGTLMSTIATFWVYVDTVDVGTVDNQGHPTN